MAKKKFDNIERNYSGGVAKIARKETDLEKKLHDRSDPENAEAIAALKNALRKEIDVQTAQRRACFRHTDKNGKGIDDVLRGDMLKAIDYDAKTANKRIRAIISKLAAFGVKTKHDQAKGKVSFENANEGGECKMVYDTTTLKKMKLETFQESAAGRISKGATDYLLAYFDVMIESSKCDDINTMATDYVAACKDGDDAKKEELKEKIAAAAKCKKAKEQLSELREKLTDDEKKFMDDLDAEICGNGDCGSEEPSPEEQEVNESGSDNDLGDGSESTQKTAKDATSAAEELNDKIQKSADAAGKDNKEAFDQLLSAASESVGLTDVGKNALLEYVTESVANGEMDIDMATCLASVVTM